MQTKDVERAQQIYNEAHKLIPHKKFTFAKLHLMHAQFEIRQMNLQQARKLLGRSIGMSPKRKLFVGYIELETKLFEFQRVRTLFMKYVEWDPTNSQAWIKFAELERGLEDMDRARAIYELAAQQPVLEMPELLWKSYIDFEEQEAREAADFDRARQLYERLLEKTNHVKVWTAYADFEVGVPEEGEEVTDEARPVSDAAKARARKVFERAYKSFKDKELKEDRVALLLSWKQFEQAYGSAEDLEKVEKQMPRRVKRRRKLDDDSFEEYMDYLFPADDEQEAKVSKLLQMAHKWKQEQAMQQNGNGEV
ncbi:NineTeen Complex (NTC) component [Coniosporium uncinatum]|uniref:NineTeen Complex (NTC) component n=1 Tax=Coniosporium uncinatum TaxID=93489 RepID=A0ACC3DNQ7_9PEZI|nr:NineTeen Complex (NTC) component [Coniosporium uncinatum]